MIYDNVKKICDERGISIMSVETACELGNGTISKWKVFLPKTGNLMKVSEYLGVPLNTLLCGEDEDGK